MNAMDKPKRQIKEIERDFIEFIALKRKIDAKIVEKQYLDLIEHFQCHTREFKELHNQIHRLYKLLYDFEDPKQQINAYKFHEFIYILRYLSYSYVTDLSTKTISVLKMNPVKRIAKYSKRLIKFVLGKSKKKDSSALMVMNKELLQDSDLTVQNWMAGLVYQYKKVAQYLVSLIDKKPIVVDYGSGLGYISFEIGKLYPNAKIYLVDIDSLVLNFTEYRFKKHGINVETIPIISDENLYPRLPKHNICIATEVMEHVIEPIKVLNNIKSSISQNGILFGNFEDHIEEEQHVSCDLSALRNELKISFVEINNLTWKKKNTVND